MGFTITNPDGRGGVPLREVELAFDPTESIIPTPVQAAHTEEGVPQVAPVAHGVIGDFVRPTADNIVASSHTTKERSVQYGVIAEAPVQAAPQVAPAHEEQPEHWFREKRKPLDEHMRKYPYSPNIAVEAHPAPHVYTEERRDSFEADVPPAPPAQPSPQPSYTEMYEPSLCDKDSRYLEATNLLPTKMLLYPFDRISVRPLQITDHIKIGSGTKTGSYRLICEAVGACIDRNWQGLAMTDFIAIAAWLRLNSYRETPFSLEWTCTASEHNREVFTGKVGEETLKNTSVFTKSDLKITPIDEERLVSLTTELARHNIFCSAPTVADFLFTLESDIIQHTEDAFLFDLATSLSPQHGKTLKDRLNFLKQYVEVTDNDTAMAVVSLLQQVTEVFESCGVVQNFNVVCKHCGEQGEKQVEIDLLTFFPFGK